MKLRALILLTLLLSVGAEAKFSGDFHDKNVLVINSYHAGFGWTDKLLAGIHSQLDDFIYVEQIYVEFMDSRRLEGDPLHLSNWITMIERKYQHNDIDLIITTDDAAFQFALSESGKHLFPDVPVVFCGVNHLYPDLLAQNHHVTGIYEGHAIQENIELAMALFPNTTKLQLIGDSAGLGAMMVADSQQLLTEWDYLDRWPDLTIEIWDDFAFEELMISLKDASSDTAVLWLVVHQDNRGRYFSYERDIATLSQVSAVPILGMWGTLQLGQGVLGGNMNSAERHGENAASIALRVLSGEAPSNIAVVSSAEYFPQFDYQQLQRFAIRGSRLPSGAIIHGQPVSFYQQYRLLVNATIVVLASMLVMLIVITRSLSRTKRAELRLNLLNQNLEKVVESRTKDLEQSNQQLKMLAETDSMTNLANRRSGEQNYKKMFWNAKSNNGTFAVLLCDIDNFKHFNDTFGHSVGDEVIIAVSQNILAELRSSDHAVRWGGEEFFIMLDIETLDIAEKVCQRLNQSVRTLTQFEHSVSISIGLACFSGDDTETSLIKRADDALYQAKRKGKDCYVLG